MVKIFKIKKIVIVLVLSLWLLAGWPPIWSGMHLAQQAIAAPPNYTTSASTFYLRSTTASSAFGTTGPTSEQSSATDLVSGSPTSKTTALAMTTDAGTSQTSVAGTETSASAGQMWFRTFLSPKLAAQTISTGTTFRFEGALAENNTGANMTFRLHIYQWREGTGKVASLIDNVAATDCGLEPGAATSERNETCVTAGTGSNATLLAGDQLAFEVWVEANNTVTTSFTGTMYFEGNGFIGQGVASAGTVIASAMSNLSVSSGLTLQTATANSSEWYLRSTTASSAFGTTGPTSEQSSATDLVSGSPTSKTTALAMTTSASNSQTSVAGTETSASAGQIWNRTFLSPKLAAQTISTGTTFRFEGALAENNLSANMTFRVHVYQWRQGTGKIASLIDTVTTTDCGLEPGAATSERNETCVTAGTGSNATLLAGDQLAFEVWVEANNTVTTSFTGTMYFEGNGFIEQGAANAGTAIASSMSKLASSQTLTLYDDSIISVSISDGSVAYGNVSPSATKDTTSGGLNDTQAATNDGNVAEDFNVKGQNSAAWTLAGSISSEQYAQSFCTTGSGSPDPCDASPSWTALTTSYQLLSSNISTSGTTRFDLMLAVPSSTSATTQQSVDVTIQAVVH